LIVGVALAMPASASAANTFYVSPGGAGNLCSPESPCPFTATFHAAVAGDTVILEPGTYSLASTSLENDHGIHLVGQAPRPVLQFNSAFILLRGTGSSVQNLEIDNSGAGQGLYVAGANALMERDFVHAAFGDACQIEGDGAILRDSLCRSGGAAAIRITSIYAGSGASGSPAIRNVTAIGDTNAILATAAFTPLRPSVLNTIARASLGATDIEADGSGQECHIAVSHSNYVTASVATSMTSVDDDGSRQAIAPAFVDVAAGDYHELPGSRTVDAGAADPSNGAADLDGNPRTAGNAPDMGAYELTAPTVATGAARNITSAGATVSGSVNNHGLAGTVQFELGVSSSYGLVVAVGRLASGLGTTPVSKLLAGLPPGTRFHYRLDFVAGSGTYPGVDRTFSTLAVGGGKAPVISRFSLSHTALIAAKAGPTIAAAVGTRVTFTLSKAASVRFTIKRTVDGVRRNGKCQAPPRRRGTKLPKCTRRLAVRGGFTYTGKAGLNGFRFMGRLNGKRLHSARYVLIAVAVDSAGRKSKRVSHRFRVVP
jgi:hypothetical protein